MSVGLNFNIAQNNLNEAKNFGLNSALYGCYRPCGELRLATQGNKIITLEGFKNESSFLRFIHIFEHFVRGISTDQKKIEALFIKSEKAVDEHHIANSYFCKIIDNVGLYPVLKFSCDNAIVNGAKFTGNIAYYGISNLLSHASDCLSKASDKIDEIAGIEGKEVSQ